MSCTLEVTWLGRQRYDDAHARQLEVREHVSAGTQGPTLLLLEHDPVVTFGRRGEAGDLRVDADDLTQRGIELRHAERGGRATYHGPGQLVGYLIGPLRTLAPDIPTYVWRLEETLIATVAAYGVAADRDPRNRGVWVDGRKLAAIGIAVTRGVCWHGFALNVDPDLAPFGLIHPCGLDVEVTSIAALRGPAPRLESVAGDGAAALARTFGLEIAYRQL